MELNGGFVGAAWAGDTTTSQFNISYCYWADVDIYGNESPSSSIGYMREGDQKTEQHVTRRPLAWMVSENINNSGTNMSYYLNQENVTGAWAQDFEGVNGKFINNKYPYLVENLPE